MNFKWLGSFLLKILTVLLIVSFASGFLLPDEEPEDEIRKVEPPFLKSDGKWIDSVMENMTLKEKLGQLFMIAVYPDKSKKHIEDVSEIIKKNKPGGIIVMKGSPERSASVISYLQDISEVNLLVGMDAEWGASMRTDSVILLPKAMTLGAIQDNKLIYEYGKEVAREMKLLGVHVNFAPVADINSNPKNPVIGIRSFGENKKNVAVKAYSYMSGMQDEGIMAVAKHFPGHGDTYKDSHKVLPVIDHPWKRLDTLELYPFKELIKNGVCGIMTAHLFIPALDTATGAAASLSRNVVTDLLIDELNYKGLIFSDALNMKGVAVGNEPGEVERKALLAGNDILLFSENIEEAINAIIKDIEDGLISEKTINKKCKKILKAKRWAFDHNPVKKINNVCKELNSLNAELIVRKTTQNSLTLIRNDNNVLPLKNLGRNSIGCISISDEPTDLFHNYLQLYDSVAILKIGNNMPEGRYEALAKGMITKDVVIVSVHSNSRNPYVGFGLNQQISSIISSIPDSSKVVLCVFASPYWLDLAGNFKGVDAIILSYEDNPYAQMYVPQLIFGGFTPTGKLPVSLVCGFREGFGLTFDGPVRLRYTIPEDIGVSSAKFYKIDSLILESIADEAFPGCQVLIAKDQAVIFNKSYGYHTYKKEREVRNTDLYDLASITKITASVPSVMRLYEDKKISIEDSLSMHLEYLVNSNKSKITIKDVLTHYAQLEPWLPFWKKTVKDSATLCKTYSNTMSAEFPFQVADNMYIIPTCRDSIRMQIAASDLRKKKEYKYSDLGYYLMQDIIEKYTGTTIDQFAYYSFYAPLGATTLGYLPLNRFSRERIVPTQEDKLFRKQLVEGYVHDPGAAMLGGVAGHAGVFSDANDLAKLMQMYLNKGEYGGMRFFQDSTLELFTSCPYCKKDNRRGIGFDKPQMNYSIEGPTCKCISGNSFGHTGFTGTMAWADPDKGVVFIFLSNRIHPDEENRKLIKKDVRTKIMEVIYDSL